MFKIKNNPFYLIFCLSGLLAGTAIGLTQAEDRAITKTEVIILPDGSLYSGDLKYEVIREGAGTNEWPNGDRYQGEWLNDMPHGKGFMQRKDKEEYRGQFLLGQYSGLGDLKTLKHERYLGVFRFNALDGLGILVTVNKEYYLGEFSQNKRHGRFLYFSRLAARPEYQIWFNDELDKIIDKDDIAEQALIKQMLQSFTKVGYKRLEQRSKNKHYQIRGRVRKRVSDVDDTPEHAYGDLIINLLNLSK